MEDIAEINDLACSSIEAGDYHTALDVLNQCLACVKQLKDCRPSLCVEGSRKGRRASLDTDNAVSIALKAAKRKLLLSPKVTFTTDASAKRTSPMSYCSCHDAPSTNTLSTTATSLTELNTRPKKRRRNEDERDQAQIQEGSECSFTRLSDPSASPIDVNTMWDTFKRLDNEEEYETIVDGGYFVYRKPLRLSKPQWSRIIQHEFRRKYCKNGCECNKKGCDKCQSYKQQQTQLEREIELAISSNLIFNIALSHHLVAISPSRTSTDDSINNSDDDSWDCDCTDCDDEDNGYGCDRESRCHLVLRKEQRLQGALRLYELGFRIHAKRAATASCSSSTPSVSTTAPRSRSNSTVARADPYPQNHEKKKENDEDELRSATRYALALINNCANIHEALGDEHRAKMFRDRLLSFLMVIIDGGESIRHIVNDDQTMDGYLNNVFMGTVFQKGAAPAAMA
jgi:hypothetical protein